MLESFTDMESFSEGDGSADITSSGNTPGVSTTEMFQTNELGLHAPIPIGVSANDAATTSGSGGMVTSSFSAQSYGSASTTSSSDAETIGEARGKAQTRSSERSTAIEHARIRAGSTCPAKERIGRY